VRATPAAIGLVVCFFASSAIVGAAAAPPPAEADARKTELAKLAPQLEDVYREMAQAVKEFDRQRFDPQAIIEQVGRDPEKLCDWMRDNVALLPYRGALRGPTGVLMERAGNSLDRSLLLAELLRSVGYEVRLGNAKLTKDQAQQLLQRLAGATKPAERQASPVSPEGQQARDRVRAQTEQLLKAITPAPDAAAAGNRLADALADHWWVQRLSGGKWLDVDTTGLTIATPARVVPYTGLGQTLSLGAQDCHEVELRVVIEAFKGDKLHTETVLKQTLRPAEVFGRTLNFTNSPGEPIKEDDLAHDPAARRRLKADLAGLHVYMPMLRVGDRPFTDASFTTAGDVDHNPTLDPAGKLSSSANKAMSGMFGGLSGDTHAATSPAGVLTAQWLEYEVRVPGRPARTIRREVFDLVGPAARAAGVRQPPNLTDAQKFLRARMLLGLTEIQLQPCEFPPEFLVYVIAKRALRDKDAWLSLVRGEINTRAKRRSFLAKVSDGDDVTPLCAVIRDGLGGPPTFIGSPNIVEHRLWMAEGDGDALVVRRGIDLAATDCDAVGPDAFRARLEQGVADTLAEHLTLGPAALPAENTFAVFEALAAKGAAPVVMRPADGAAALAKLQMPADAKARAAADLAAGQTLVLAGDPDGRWTWWRIDARSGQTVGVMDNGYNADMTEEAKINKWVTDMARVWGEDINAAKLEGASPNQVLSWSRGIPARLSLLEGWQTMLKALTAASLWREG